MSVEFTIVAWGAERPTTTFHAFCARDAYTLVLTNALSASLEVEIHDPAGAVLSLEQLEQLVLTEVVINQRQLEPDPIRLNVRKTLGSTFALTQ